MRDGDGDGERERNRNGNLSLLVTCSFLKAGSNSNLFLTFPKNLTFLIY